MNLFIVRYTSFVKGVSLFNLDHFELNLSNKGNFKSNTRCVFFANLLKVSRRSLENTISGGRTDF